MFCVGVTIFNVVVLLLVQCLVVECNDDCPPAYWGENCVNYCGYCREAPVSNVSSETNCTTGDCLQEGRHKKHHTRDVEDYEWPKFQDNYDRNCTSSDGKCPYGCIDGWGGDRCDEAECEGGCGNGECLVPGFCGNCGGISYVSPHCIDIRIRGLEAAAVSLAVLTFVVVLFGFLSQRKKIITA